MASISTSLSPCSSLEVNEIFCLQCCLIDLWVEFLAAEDRIVFPLVAYYRILLDLIRILKKMQMLSGPFGFVVCKFG